MKNSNLNTAIDNLVEAIRGLMLGSVEVVVIDQAGKALITNWNDHNAEDKIEETEELKKWWQERETEAAIESFESQNDKHEIK